jgi:hypothetical protein
VGGVAGRLTDWTLENVRIAGNRTVVGTVTCGMITASVPFLSPLVVEWDGCENVSVASNRMLRSGAVTATCRGEPGDWIIELALPTRTRLLYHTLGGSIASNGAEGNAGNQVKVTGQTEITNSVLVGNCAFFENQPFTYWVDHCRALGNTLEIVFTGGEQVSIVNSTLYGQGDGLVGGGAREGFECSGAETITARNSIFLGDADHFDPSDLTFLFYQEGCSDLNSIRITTSSQRQGCQLWCLTGNYTTSARTTCEIRCLRVRFPGKCGMVLNPAARPGGAGEDSVCQPVDILGARPQMGTGMAAACDMGAYEVP